MALLLAPYNDAMRLGMGFNSFTQQLCINDAVRIADGKQGISPDDTHLRPQYKLGLMTAADGSNISVSQKVDWTAKFVDRISDVTDSLNVGGSLQIKLDAISASAQASFVDAKKFKESDINYLLQVKVINQHLIAPDLTQFEPLAHVPDSEFTRVYGDSFISGFIEGGEFNALISIKLNDHSEARSIKAELKGQIDLKAISVSGEASADKEDMSSNIDGETTISVSWKGGGDIKDETVTDWTLSALKAVALEFPEHVMACPIRTNAILTKYTALKSFYASQIKATPLEYENAGVYSSALLDAYMDYKVMWRDIQQASWEVEQGQSLLAGKADIPEFAEMALEAKTDFSNRMKEYQRKVDAVCARFNAAKALPAPAPASDQSAADPNSVSSPAPAASADPLADIPPADMPVTPMPPNELKPYKATLFGLDKARRDCRFEMIKIVREVDAVADDPRVACDPTRLYQYLAPAVFRMLLPTVTNLSKQRAAELAAEEAQKLQDQQNKEKQSLDDTIASSKRDIASLTDKNAALEKTKTDLEQKLAKVNPYDGWAPFAVNQPIRMRNVATGKCCEFAWANENPAPPNAQGAAFQGQAMAAQAARQAAIASNANLTLLQAPASNNPNQKFEIISLGGKSFALRHVVSGKYITPRGAPTNVVGLFPGDFPFPFTFQRLDAAAPTGPLRGKLMIHFAEQDQYTFNIEGGVGTGTNRVIGWAGGKQENDMWWIKGFDDMST